MCVSTISYQNLSHTGRKTIADDESTFPSLGQQKNRLLERQLHTAAQIATTSTPISAIQFNTAPPTTVVLQLGEPSGWAASARYSPWSRTQARKLCRIGLQIDGVILQETRPANSLIASVAYRILRCYLRERGHKFRHCDQSDG